MRVELIVAEIGSTTTVVNAFSAVKENNPRFLGQGMAPTSIAEGDVTLGLRRAEEDLAKNIGTSSIEADEVLCSSSAAGGLSMSVHGLVPDMTVRAAREAALGSGAVLRMVTSGKLGPRDLQKLTSIAPRVVMVAGGTEGGERETALFNFEQIAQLKMNVPILYAGNSDNHEDIRALADEHEALLYLADNVYPSVDQLNSKAARHVIQAIFEEHIIHAPGMAHIREVVTGTIMPTPGAVMAMTEKLYEVMGDLLTIDVGGATTDIHSVTRGSEALYEFSVDPEPLAKRTVEGDLGVFINRAHVLEAMNAKECASLPDDYRELLDKVPEIPRNKEEMALIMPLVRSCCREALDRHAGRMSEIFTARGRRKVVRGRDLTAVKTLITTGGALTRFSNVEPMIRELLRAPEPERLYPPPDLRVMMDKDYLMASSGVMAATYPEAAVRLMLNSLDIGTIGGNDVVS